MATGHEAHANSAPYCLGYLALVRRSQPRLIGMLDAAHSRHELGHHNRVLLHISHEPQTFPHL